MLPGESFEICPCCGVPVDFCIFDEISEKRVALGENKWQYTSVRVVPMVVVSVIRNYTS
jgi:hypothetical protein